jgi:carbonic anhydrase
MFLSAKYARLGALVFLVAASAAAAPPQEQKEGPHWTYSGKDNPGHWGDLDPAFAECKAGQHQSPIDITKTEKAKLDVIEFHYQTSPLKVTDNGHTIQVSYAPGSFITVGGHQYNLMQFHFHHPSEEKIHGKKAAMEAHLVHSDADGKLAVVAVLLQQGSANPAVRSVWQNLPKERNALHEVDNVSVNAADLVPPDHGYYTFTGSLTTPPCSEDVTWFVMKTPTTISADELAAFAKLYPHDARPTQALHGRVVKESE